MRFRVFLSIVGTAAGLIVLPVVASAADISWKSATSGNWGDQNNWNPAMVPGAADNALITLAGSYTVTLNVAAEVASLTLGAATGTQTLSNASQTLTLDGASTINANGVYSQINGTLTGAGTLTVNGVVNWSGGTMSGAGAMAVGAGGTLNLNGGVALRRAVNNAGTTTWSAGSISSGDGATFTNQSGGTFAIKSDQGWFFNLGGGTPQFINQTGGTVTKSTTSGTTTFSTSVSFTNSGVVTVSNGVLALNGGGASNTPFSVAAGARVDVNASTYTLNSGAGFTGPGAARVNGGTLVVAADLTAVNVELMNGTLTGAGNLTISATFNGDFVGIDTRPFPRYKEGMIREDAFDREFPDETACKQYLATKRWPDGVRCPRCGAKEKIYALKTRPFHWICKDGECGGRNGYRFSVLTRTIFQDTKIPLKLWYKVGFLMLTAKKGLSSLQVRRVIFGEESGTDWRTCWYMCHRWRAAMRGDVIKLDGIVEVDETYIGGKDKNRHQHKKSKVARDAAGKELKPHKMYRAGEAIGYKKITVIGAIARKGNVVARVLGDMDARTKTDFVKAAVSEKVELVATDEDPAFNYVDKDMPHEAVNHSANEYVRGIVHTGTIDGFWSLLKRGIMGSYHHVSKDYLPLYLNEFSFRYNNRKNPDAFGLLMTTCS